MTLITPRTSKAVVTALGESFDFDEVNEEESKVNISPGEKTKYQEPVAETITKNLQIRKFHNEVCYNN